MFKLIRQLFGLLLGITLLLIGMGLLSSLLGVRATLAHFPGWQLGLVMSAYFVGFILGSFLCPRLIRSVGPIRTFAALAAIVTSTTLAYALSDNPWWWVLLRLVSGTAMVGLYMVAESWLNASLPRAYRVRIFGVYVMLTLVAMATGQLLFTAAPATGSTLFLIAGMLVVLGLVPVTATPLEQPQLVHSRHLPPWALVQRAPFAVGATFLSGLATGAFWGLGAAFAARIGLPPTGVGAFVACVIGGGVLAQWPMGRLSDHLGRRPVLIGAAVTGAVFAFLLAVATQGPLWLLLSLAFGFGGATFSLYSLAVAHTNDLLQADEVLAATQGLLLSVGVGSAFGPLIGGVMFDVAGARGLPYYFATVLAVLALFGIVRSYQRLAPPLTDQSEFVPMVRTSQVGLEMAVEVGDDDSVRSA